MVSCDANMPCVITGSLIIGFNAFPTETRYVPPALRGAGVQEQQHGGGGSGYDNRGGSGGGGYGGGYQRNDDRGGAGGQSFSNSR